MHRRPRARGEQGGRALDILLPVGHIRPALPGNLENISADLHNIAADLRNISADLQYRARGKSFNYSTG